MKLKYNDIDVSRNSNGDKTSCSIIILPSEITNLTSTSATLSWQKPICDQICIGYTLFYRMSKSGDNSKLNSKDVCQDNNWNSIFTPNTTITLNQLSSFKTYAFYIKYYQSSGLPGSETNLAYFNTLPDSPPQPASLIAVGISPDVIQLQWNGSSDNGILSHYIAKYSVVVDMDIQNLRDYCTNPRT